MKFLGARGVGCTDRAVTTPSTRAEVFFADAAGNATTPMEASRVEVVTVGREGEPMILAFARVTVLDPGQAGSTPDSDLCAAVLAAGAEGEPVIAPWEQRADVREDRT